MRVNSVLSSSCSVTHIQRIAFMYFYAMRRLQSICPPIPYNSSSFPCAHSPVLWKYVSQCRVVIENADKMRSRWWETLTQKPLQNSPGKRGSIKSCWVFGVDLLLSNFIGHLHIMTRLGVGTNRASRQRTCTPNRMLCSTPSILLTKEEGVLRCIHKTNAINLKWSVINSVMPRASHFNRIS